MRYFLLTLIVMSLALGRDIKRIVIDNPGVLGIDNYTSDNIVNIKSSREMVDCDIEDADIGKRIGYYIGAVSTDTLCDGITPFYDFENNARLLKVNYSEDTGVICFSNPNSFTFATDSVINMYQYKAPASGYDWVQFENAIFGANGKNQPIFYSKDQWGTLSIPTPGAPMVSPLNIDGNQTGTYSYRLHYFTAGDTTKKSYPGPETGLVFSEGNATMLWFFPERVLNATTWDTNCVLITRNKDNESKFYVLDTITYKRADGIFYIDTSSDAQLGDSIFIGDSAVCNCCEDTILVPGEPYLNITNNAWDSSSLGAGSHADSQYVAVAYIDTNFGITSAIGPWIRRTPISGGDTAATFWYWGSIDTTFGSNFIDGLIIFMSENNDSTRFKIFDTSWGEVRDTIHEWTEVGVGDWWTKWASELDSTTWFARAYRSLFLTNKLPYDCMDFSYSRLWAAGDDDYPSRLYYSGRSDTGILAASGLFEWDYVYNYLALDENDGDPITGVHGTEAGLVVYKGHSAWLIIGDDPDYNLYIRKLSSSIGAVCNNAIVDYMGSDYFLSSDARVYKRTGYEFIDISFPIRNSLKNLSIDSLSSAVSIIYDGNLWLRVNDTLFICDLKMENLPWRKYGFAPQYFNYYDASTNTDYVRKKKLVFTKNDSDSIFTFPRATGTFIDLITAKFGALYISAPFLVGFNTKVLSGTIDVEMDTGDSLYIRLLSLNNDTLGTATIRDGEQISGDNFEFAFNAPFSNGYHFLITEDLNYTNTTTFRVKRITLDYIEVKKLGK